MSVISMESDTKHYSLGERLSKKMITRFQYEIEMQKVHLDRPISTWATHSLAHMVSSPPTNEELKKVNDCESDYRCEICGRVTLNDSRRCPKHGGKSNR